MDSATAFLTNNGFIGEVNNPYCKVVNWVNQTI